MGVLNSYQRMSRVTPTKPWGHGLSGPVTISADPNTRGTITGTSGSPNMTVPSAGLANGEYFVAHQTRGTGADNWEILRVLSGGGTSSIVCTTNLQHTYSTGAQFIQFDDNSVVTVNNYTVTPWNGSTGGIGVICGRDSITLAGGAINFAGTAGSMSASDNAGDVSGGGFRSGRRTTDGNYGGAGEGNSGTYDSGDYGSSSAQGNGGGAAFISGDGGAGGAGGNAGAGTSGRGTGGAAAGSSDLTTFSLGGGGGGGACDGSGGQTQSGSGGSGGGALILITRNLIVTGALSADGGAGGEGGGFLRVGGAGAGGSILVMCQTATLGSNKITAIGGASTQVAGSAGRIAIHHSATVTGTTNPSFVDVSDSTLMELSGGVLLAAI